MIFDINMDDKFIGKYTFVARGHNTIPPTFVTQFISVTHNIVWVAYLLAAFNCLGISVADIDNSYLYATCR